MMIRGYDKLALVLAVSLGFGAWTGLSQPVSADDAGAAGSAQTKDPLEPINRVTSEFNRFLRGLVIDPVVDGYQAVTPEPVQDAVSNAVSNLSEPVTAVSSMLQGDTENAKSAAGRFIINTTVGVGGLGDPAAGMGMQSRPEDLGQAFGAHGASPGAHVVLPIIGPSNLRDLTGDALTAIANPLPLAATAAGGAVNYSDVQDEVNAVGGAALDPYVAEREAYEQSRRYQVLNGDVPSQAFPSFADAEDEDVKASGGLAAKPSAQPQ